MRKNNLQATGLSLSQAQSYSNQINQIANDLQEKVDGVNNFSQTVLVKDTKVVNIQPLPIPIDVIEILEKICSYRATQAFLMENIKAKDAELNAARRESYVHPRKFDFDLELNPLVSDEWGWEQLTAKELNEFTEFQAKAAHLGQYIHLGGTLSRLRRDLPKIKGVEWMEVRKDEKTPMLSEIHHTSEQLLEIHNKIALLHTQAEQRVNYFKAKVKNSVTSENANIQKENNVKQMEYNTLATEFNKERGVEETKFEVERLGKIKTIAAKRILVDDRFQKIINLVKGNTEAEAEAEA